MINATNTNAPLIFLKIGGSLITDRREYCTVDRGGVERYVSELRGAYERLSGRLVLVLGGGSFGHKTVERYGLDRPPATRGIAGINALTINMMRMKLEWVHLLEQAGVPCYPFQTSAFVQTEQHAIREAMTGPILAAARRGLLPVLSGDVVFDRALGYVLFSSDRVHEAFLGHVELARVVFLTDVPGVLNAAGELIRSVDARNADAVLAHAGPSDKLDVTDGMRGKLRALLAAARRGVTCLIADGRDPARGMCGLEEDGHVGTWLWPQEPPRVDDEQVRA